MAWTSFQRSAMLKPHERTVGVVNRTEEVLPGFVLLSGGKCTYLIDEDGVLRHEWRAKRIVFAAYLRENGNLLRDGSENLDAPLFMAGGAAGHVEEVTWEGELVWQTQFVPFYKYLSHHSLEVMPNGNVLVLVWKRVDATEAKRRGRRADLLPDGELWDNMVCEVEPHPETQSAEVVWTWSLLDHSTSSAPRDSLQTDDGANSIASYDINACPNGGKQGQRNRLTLLGGGAPGLDACDIKTSGSTGEKDWLHINSLSFDPVRNQILLSVNTQREILIVDRESKQIVYRWGNPQMCGLGTSVDQKLFTQHSVSFIRGCPGEGNVLLFNNGRIPDRPFSTVDELELPETVPGSGKYVRENHRPFGPEKPVWTFGPPANQLGSFYCTHISSCQRLQNGNTLVNMGTMAIIVEVTPAGQECWRYVSPVVLDSASPGTVTFIEQGSFPYPGSRRSLFIANKYAADFAGLRGRELPRIRYLEA